MIKLPLLLVLLLSFCAFSSAEIYKSVDENGNVIFSDDKAAAPEAEKVDLPPMNTAPEVQTRTPLKKQPVTEAFSYTLSITSPVDNGTVPAGERSLIIVADLQPDLIKGHRLQIFMNGTRVPSSGNTATVADPERGSHKLYARVIDNKGKQLTRSATITVHVQRTSTLNPNHPGNRPTPHQK